MVKIGLQLKANLTNVSRLYPSKPEQFGWPIKVKCTGCGEESQNWHLISQDETVKLVNTEANFVYKCKCCSRENSITIIPSNQVNTSAKGGPSRKLINTVYEESDEDKFKTIISFDCRGLELINFEPRDGWTVESGKKVFSDIDLTDNEWFEYNDIDNVPVEINNIEHKFIVLK